MPGNNTNEFKGLFSYVRTDDDIEGGRLTDLRRALESELQIQTGHKVPIFQDTEDTSIGKHWLNTITDVIDSSIFLIAVITPSFLNSKMCRQEVSRFISREKSLGREGLIFPILYLQTPSLENNEDEIAVNLYQRQYHSCEHIRFKDSNSNDYRKTISEISAQIISTIEHNLEETESETKATKKGQSDQIKPVTRIESPGFIEILTETEETLPLFVQSINEFSEKIDEFSTETNSATTEITTAQQSGKPASASLSAIVRFSRRLEPLTNDLELIADNFQDRLYTVDLGMSALTEQLSYEVKENDLKAARSLLASLENLVSEGETGIGSLRHLKDSIAKLYRLSSTLTPVLRRVSTSINKILPSQTHFIRWRDDLDDVLGKQSV